MTGENTVAQQIELCTQRIAGYKARLASLSDHPDGGPAREMLAKTIASEERLKENLLAIRTRPGRRNWRTGQTRVTPGWLVFIAVVFVASYAAAHFLHLRLPR